MAVAVVVVDGLVDSEQPTSASMIVTTRSGVARQIVRMLATADRSTVASRRLWLKVFTSRRLREIVCDPGRVGLQRVFRIGACDINGEEVPVVRSGPTASHHRRGGGNLEMRDRGLAIDEVLVVLGVEHGGLYVGSREPDDGSP